MLKPRFLALSMSTLALGLAACGGSTKSTGSAPTPPAASTPTTATSTSSTTSSASNATVTISTASVPGLGTILVNAKGHTLYTFAPDKKSRVTCTGGCASVWPPAKLPTGAKPVAAGQVKQSLLASDPDPTGGLVITYAGWPLYTYVVDTAPGQHAGQALNLNGGVWHVISPAGTVITKTP